VNHAQEKGMSERRACQLVNQPRGTQRYQPTQREDEDRLTQAIIALASQYGRYGYRRITALLQRTGWRVGKDRVERIWRREGLKVPKKQKPRGRLWLNDGSCVRLRPERVRHVWSYDFVSASFTFKHNLTQRCMSQRCERPDAVDLRRSQNWKNLSVSGKRTVHEIRSHRRSLHQAANCLR
jgi:transposase InsO family protein